MSQSRIDQALQSALQATPPDPQSRYTTAMIARANDILARSRQTADPAECLPPIAADPAALSALIRARQTPANIAPLLRSFVVAKLRISNPDFLEKTTDTRQTP